MNYESTVPRLVPLDFMKINRPVKIDHSDESRDEKGWPISLYGAMF